MTTTARPAPGQLRRGTPLVLLVAGLCVAVAVAVVTLLGGLVTGSSGALGAVVGGSVTLCLLMFGSLVVETATRMAPQTAVVIALMTYTLQVVMVAAFFAVLKSSGALGTSLSAGWLATGVIVATSVWTVGQLVASAKARVPAYDIELPGASQPSSQGLSQPREVGAP